MTWTPSPALKRAADLVAEIISAQSTCGAIIPPTSTADLVLLHHRMVNIIGDALIEARKAGVNFDPVPYSKTTEYQEKLAEAKKGNGGAPWPERYTPDEVVKLKGEIHKTWLDGLTEKKPPTIMTWSDGTYIDPQIWAMAEASVGPGSIVNNAADIAAYQDKVKAAYDRLKALAYPPAKDNLQDLAATVKQQAEVILEQAGEIFTKAEKLAEIGGPWVTPEELLKPGGIIDTHVGTAPGTAWGEGPQRALVENEGAHFPPSDGPPPEMSHITPEEWATYHAPTKPLGAAPGASVDAETLGAKGGQPKKKVGRPKGSYGKKKKEAMRKAKAAERAAAKAAKETVVDVVDLPEPLIVTVDPEGQATIEVPEVGLGSESWRQADLEETERGG